MDEDENWDGEKRRIDPEMLQDVLGRDLNEFHFMIAGPPGMAKGVQAALSEAGLPDEQVQADSFSGY
jgi:NAD(P)H-flavin reductase